MPSRRLAWLVVMALIAGCIACAASSESFASRPDTIFVSIASYRDQECANTLRDIFQRAHTPERVFVGICEQNTSAPSEACLPPDFAYHANIRRLTIPHTEAKGPTYARYLCSTLYRGETYFMQIDSHTMFVDHWDQKAIAELKATPNPARAVLSHYPHDIASHTREERSVPILCDSKIGPNGLPSLLAGVKTPAQIEALKGKMFPIPFTSGGFLFAPGTVLRDCPYDPNLPHLFQGEEILYSVRLWTHGYDFWTPRVNIVFHKYGRKGEKRWHEDNSNWYPEQKEAEKRVKRLLKLEGPAITSDPFGMGRARSVEDYWTYSGLDPKNKVANSKAKFC